MQDHEWWIRELCKQVNVKMARTMMKMGQQWWCSFGRRDFSHVQGDNDETLGNTARLSSLGEIWKQACLWCMKKKLLGWTKNLWPHWNTSKVQGKDVFPEELSKENEIKMVKISSLLFCHLLGQMKRQFLTISSKEEVSWWVHRVMVMWNTHPL